MNETNSNTKVAVHSQRWISPKGQSGKFSEFHVFAGTNPLGPRGGRQCQVVDGKHVAGRFRTREDATTWAKNFAEQNSYEFVG